MFFLFVFCFSVVLLLLLLFCLGLCFCKFVRGSVGLHVHVPVGPFVGRWLSSMVVVDESRNGSERA